MKKFKTKPYKHQRKALALSMKKKAFALLMEQGTGKSKVIVDTTAALWRDRKIDLLIVITPKGVAPAWIREQIPTHMPDDIDYKAALWRSSMSKTMQRHITEVQRHDGLKIYVMNIEAFGATTSAIDFAIDALKSSISAMLVVDESHRMKTPSTSTAKRILNIGKFAEYRRILTGTVADKPFDLFSQFTFLDPNIFNTTSFTAFRGEYAVMEPATAGIMRHIAMRIPKVWKGRYINDDTGQPADEPRNDDGSMRKKLMEPAYLPAIVKKNEDGSPQYRNLDKLKALIDPISFRVLKKDCLDLPSKIYSRYYTEMTPKQEETYNKVKTEMRIEWLDGSLTPLNKLTAMLRLQQIVCGYLQGKGEQMIPLFNGWEGNPRIKSMLDYIEDRSDRAIIWCRFVEDINQVSAALRDAYGAGSVVQFYGAVNERNRIDAVERFQGERLIIGKSGTVLRKEPVPNAQRARFMVAQQRAGGVGQTWTAASLSLHYSNTFSLIDRLQAEDRPHRIGQRNTVQYTDMETEGTVDTIIINAMIGKKNVADIINGDEITSWIRQ